MRRHPEELIVTPVQTGVHPSLRLDSRSGAGMTGQAARQPVTPLQASADGR